MGAVGPQAPLYPALAPRMTRMRRWRGSRRLRVGPRRLPHILTCPRATPLSMATEIWAIVGVENSPLCFWSVSSVASGRNDGGEIAEIEFDDGVEGFCGGSLAEAVG